jgi:hypothetical protein
VFDALLDLVKRAALKPDVQLQPHQQRIVDRMTEGDNRLLLYHGLGSGKSLASLAAAEVAGGDYTVVTPASLRQNYEKEIEKFTENSSPEVMSYTGIGAGKVPRKTPQTIIFDEAHRLRNPVTAGATAARDLTRDARNLLLLTGTPITNEPSDLASLISLLHNERMSPEEFKERFVGYRKVYPSLLSRLTGNGFGEEVFVQNEDELRSLLRGKVDYQPSKTPEGVDVQEETIKVPMSPQQELIQNAITSRIPSDWAWKLNEEFPLSQSELNGLNWFLTGLRQSSLSTQPFRNDEDTLTAFRQSGKLQKAYADLQKELSSDPRRKAIVYSNYIGAGIEPYAAALEADKVPYGIFHGGIPLKQRMETLQDYNEGKIRALLLGPAAAEGISTKGTNLIQLLDPHWHESRSAQARGRGLRFDSHTELPEDLKNVTVKRYISESKEPSLLGRLMGYRRQRTGDEILQNLAARKEKANDLFRQILREEGASKKAGYDLVDHTFRRDTVRSLIVERQSAHVFGAVIGDYIGGRLMEKAAAAKGKEHVVRDAAQLRRELTPAELALIETQQQRWLPDVVQHGGTPLTSTMASPLMGGLLFGVPGALAGGLGGAMLGSNSNNPAAGAAIGGGVGAMLGGALVGGPVAMTRYQDNATMAEAMKRLPPGATLLDVYGPGGKDVVDGSSQSAQLRNAVILSHILRQLH